MKSIRSIIQKIKEKICVEPTCYLCHGDRAVASPNRGSQMAEVWCPNCNLIAYLKETGQESIKDQKTIFNSNKALDYLKEDLEYLTKSYDGYTKMFKFQADVILRRAEKKCLELIAQNPGS